METRHRVLFYYLVAGVSEITQFHGKPETPGALPAQSQVPGCEGRKIGLRAGTGGRVADAGDLPADIGPEGLPRAKNVEGPAMQRNIRDLPGIGRVKGAVKAVPGGDSGLPGGGCIGRCCAPLVPEHVHGTYIEHTPSEEAPVGDGNEFIRDVVEV